MFLEVILGLLEVMQCSWVYAHVPEGYSMFLEVIQQGVGIELLGQLKRKINLCQKNNMEILAHKSALNSSNFSKEKQTKKVLIKVHKIV